MLKRFLWFSLIIFCLCFTLNGAESSSIKPEGLKTPALVEDLGKITARIQVEGASFRSFRLVFDKTAAFSKNLSPQFLKLGSEILNIIEHDLEISGGFLLISHESAIGKKHLQKTDEKLLKQFGAEGISKISFSFNGDSLKIDLENKNLITSHSVSKKFLKTSDIRSLAHMVAQNIYESFIGPENLFVSQIAAIKRIKSGNQIKSQVVLLDFDGKNERVIADGSWLKSSPSFAPDGQSILFGVTMPNGHGIVEKSLKNLKAERFLSKRAGLNLDPRVTPDNKSLLLTLSENGGPHIYLADRQGKNLKKLTSGFSMNLSPSINPKGDMMAFVSTRSGNPQIYLQSLSDKSEAKRITFQGKYNQTPAFNADGKMVAFTGRDEKGRFDIFIIEIDSGRISRVTSDQGRNQEPFFSNSGRFIFYSSAERPEHEASEIYFSNLSGSKHTRLTFGGNYLSPTVRPIK